MSNNPALTHRADRGRMVNVPAAAEYLQLSTKTVRKLIAQGKIPGYYISARALRIRMSDLDAFIESTSTTRFGGGA